MEIACNVQKRLRRRVGNGAYQQRHPVTAQVAAAAPGTGLQLSTLAMVPANSIVVVAVVIPVVRQCTLSTADKIKTMAEWRSIDGNDT